MKSGGHTLPDGFQIKWKETFGENYSDIYEKPWQDDPQYAEQGWCKPDPLDEDDLILDPLLMNGATRAMVLEGFQEQMSEAGDEVQRKPANRRTWFNVSGSYLVQTFKSGQYATAKDFFTALEKEAGVDSPFDKGTGANRGSLFVREIGKAVPLKTLENKMPDIRRASKMG